MNAEQKRAIARQALDATIELEKAIKKGNLRDIQRFMDAGALPELAHFANKKGTPTGSALSYALPHKDALIVQYLLEQGAPLIGDNKTTLGHTCISLDFLDGLSLLAKAGYSALPEDYLLALETDNLDALKILDSIKPWSNYLPTGQDRLSLDGWESPLFLVKSRKMVDYLVLTGASFKSKKKDFDALMWAIGQDEDEAALALLDHGHPIEAGSLWMACRQENNAMIRTLSERAPHLSWQKKSTEKYEDTDDYNYRRELLDNDPDLFEELMEKEKSRKQRQGLDQATPSVKRQRSSRL